MAVLIPAYLDETDTVVVVPLNRTILMQLAMGGSGWEGAKM